MKTRIVAVALAAAALCAGSTVAQTRPQAPAPRAAVPTPPPAVGTVPTGQGQGQTRGTGGDGSNRDHIDQDAQMDVRDGARFPTNLGATPVSGVGGQGGGRYTTPGIRVINNSETDTAVADPSAAPDIESAGGVNQTAGTLRGRDTLPSSQVSRPAAAPVTPR
ncbi:MAG: hypothetical protein KKG54_07410 [Alphaproteobacteria bacterium]|nr:hypothetical protein [Alphaproteobacteria bacterium]MBU4039145.1 hypothetical protein [Alphaproteobacteria bacterium]MBU4135110.1 hypothetical protein [Alphaproteobacteria bacterium]